VFDLDGSMNDQTKQNIRRKVATYIKRAEEIKKITKQAPQEKKPVASDATGRGSPQSNRKNEDEGDVDKQRMMQKFEGKLPHHYAAVINLVLIYFRL
jgi:hypothetical protein